MFYYTGSDSSVCYLRNYFGYKGSIFFTQDDPQFSYNETAHRHKKTGIGFIATCGNGLLATNGADFISYDAGSFGCAVMSKRIVEEFEELERAFYAYVDEKTK